MKLLRTIQPTFCIIYIFLYIVAGHGQEEDGDANSPSVQAALKSHHAPANLLSQFATLIDCTTGRSPILDYGNYGCFCGIGGKGTPIDETDQCCQDHDKCYHSLIQYGDCPDKMTIMIRWYSFFSEGCRTPNVTISCKEPRAYGLFERLLSGINPHCANAICECDKMAALCFRNAEFNPKHRVYNKVFLCGGPEIPAASAGPVPIIN